MVRRLAAVVTLVVAALLIHLAVPHHSLGLATARQQATGSSGPGQAVPVMHGTSRAEPAESHHESTDDLVAVPTRADNRDVPPTATAVSAADSETGTAADDLPAVPHARTARD